MNDLLAALIFVIIGRMLISLSSHDSNLATLGMIIMVLSITLIVVGLLYIIRNTLWIRSADCGLLSIGAGAGALQVPSSRGTVLLDAACVPV